MITNHQNLSGTSVANLSLVNTDVTGKLYTIERLLICNTDTTAVTVSLYLDDGAGETIYLLKNTNIPIGVTLDFLNGIPLSYESKYNLAIVLGDAAFTADVMFNQK
jgi:hypothetical protein|tara:strand:- start:183 stop:500 length:318 start_codon:yes stop_codon:yes gene_type:complete